MFHYYYFCHIYHPNINHIMKSLICTELLHTPLLLRCVIRDFDVENIPIN